MQRTSGIQVLTSKNLRNWSLPEPHLPSSAIFGPWGTEGPEMLMVNGSLRLYFDCTFQPVPTGHERPPYGVATARLATASLASPAAWTTIEGSCTGTGTQLAFPRGATHGSFICVDAVTSAALEAAWRVPGQVSYASHPSSRSASPRTSLGAARATWPAIAAALLLAIAAWVWRTGKRAARERVDEKQLFMPGATRASNGECTVG